jgi:hypothetical protein
MDRNKIIEPPSLSDERARAQGFNDWLVFGNAASAYSARMIGYEDYNQGKKDAKEWFYRTRKGQASFKPTHEVNK